MASIRTRQRKDGTGYTSVLYVHNGKQTSSSFNDHAEALRFQDVCNRLGPAEALKIWETAAPRNGGGNYSDPPTGSFGTSRHHILAVQVMPSTASAGRFEYFTVAIRN